MHSYREYAPATRIVGHVACVWVQTVGTGSPAVGHRTVPTGAVEIHVRPGAVPRVVGPHRRAIVEHVLAGTVSVGVRMRPQAGSSLFREPVGDLVDQHVGLDELWGADALELAEQLATAASSEQKIALLEDAIARRVSAAPPVDPLVAEAMLRLHHPDGARVTEVAEALGMSPRHLGRRVVAAVGLAPKTLARILRFQRFLVIARTRRDRDGGLARLAVEAGYADQAHLTHAAGDLLGVPPRALLTETAKACGSTHDHAVSWAPFLTTGH